MGILSLGTTFGKEWKTLWREWLSTTLLLSNKSISEVFLVPFLYVNVKSEVGEPISLAMLELVSKLRTQFATHLCPLPRTLQWWHVEEKNFFFFLFRVSFKIIILFFFLFQSCYKGNSLHDYKLKNTQECTTQMLTSKLMYKESKCMWGCITWCKSCTAIKPCVCVCVCTCSQDLKLVIKQALELLAPSSFRSSGI